MSSDELQTVTNNTPETFEAVSILEHNEKAEQFGYIPGERIILNGEKRNLNKYVEEDGGRFVQYAERVGTIELDEPMTDEEIMEWCNSEAGMHALAPYFDDIYPSEKTAEEVR